MKIPQSFFLNYFYRSTPRGFRTDLLKKLNNSLTKRPIDFRSYDVVEQGLQIPKTLAQWGTP